MRRNAVFCDAVHFVGADLDFESFAVRHDGCVQGLIIVRLRHCDIVLEPAGNGLPHSVHFSEHSVTVLDGVHYDARREQVVNLVHVYVQLVHLLIYGIEVLRSAVDLAVYAHFLHFFAYLFHYAVEERLSLAALFADTFRDVLILVGIQIHHCEVFELAFEEGYSEPARKRSVNIQRFFGYALLFFGRNEAERAHIVQSVREFYDYDAQILCHRHKEFSEILRLCVLAVGELQFVELCDALHEL